MTSLMTVKARKTGKIREKHLDSFFGNLIYVIAFSHVLIT